MQLFLCLMTTSISLMLILENDGLQLMSLLDGSFLEADSNYPDSSNISLGSGALHQKYHTKMTVEEELRRIASLWDPVLNKSYDPTNFKGYNDTFRISKKLSKKEHINTYQKMEDERKRIKSLWDPDLNKTFDSLVLEDRSVGNQSVENQIRASELVQQNHSKKLEVEEGWYPIHNKRLTSVYPNSSTLANRSSQTFDNSNFSMPNYNYARVKNLENKSSMKEPPWRKKKPKYFNPYNWLPRNWFALNLQVYMHRKPVYGRTYSIFLTMPSLGDETFVLNITVSSQDYLIDEIITAVDMRYSGWSYTNNLRKLLKKRGIKVFRVPYNRCYYYRSKATFYATGLNYLICQVSGLERRDVLLGYTNMRFEVQRSPGMGCVPTLGLEFCKNPEEPVEYSPWTRLEFFANIGTGCRTVKYGKIEWDFYDITETDLICHLTRSTGLLVKINPYELDFLYDPDAKKIFILRGRVKINNVYTLARCYVIYRTPQIEPRIKGNMRRKVDIRKPIEIDGSRTKDRLRKTEAHDTKHFFWDCRSLDDPGNRYCQFHMSEKHSMKFPANVLKENAVYDYSLTVISQIDPQNRRTTHQLLRGVTTRTITPQIICRRNCRLGVYSPLESVHLIPRCEDCPSKILRYEWWVLVNGSQPHFASQQKYLILKYDETVLSIRLRLVLSATLYGDAFHKLRRNDGPQNGICHIDPDFGLEAFTEFEISCTGFVAIHPPMNYRYVTAKGVIATNVPYSRIKLTLPATRYVQVSICDATHTCVKRDLQVDIESVRYSQSYYTGDIEDLMGPAPRLLHHGEWNQAYVRSIVASKWIENPEQARLVYSPLGKVVATTGSQLEQLTSLATHILVQLVPVDYQGAQLMAKIFRQLSATFEVILKEQEWLHREAYFSLTAMYMFFMGILSKKSERHSASMCKLYNPECINLRIIDLEKNFEIHFDTIVLLRINSWMINTWYLYKCIFYLGAMATHRHHPYDEVMTVSAIGTAYQINVTEVADRVQPITMATMDNSHTVEVSVALLLELKADLKHTDILFQTISQQNNHNIFWWYPEPLPARTSVLIVHAFSPETYYKSEEESVLENPLVFKTNITQFNDQFAFTRWMANGSIANGTQINIYRLILNSKAMLAVRIVSCTELMYVKLRLHKWPSLKEIEQSSCHIYPDMGGRRIWLSNSCKESRAFVSIHRPGDPDRAAKSRMRRQVSYDNEDQDDDDRFLNYSILMEIYQCNFWKNSSLDPGWSEDHCTTTFESSYGSSVQCTCHTLGTLASRTYPISAELYVEYVPTPVFFFYAYILVVFFLFLGLIVAQLVFSADFIMAHLRQPSFMECDSIKKTQSLHQLDGGAEILLVVATGAQEFAGTTSNVKFYFKSPHRQQTSYQITQDPGRPQLLRNSIIQLRVPRGSIYIPTRLALGTDRNGRYPSWFCRSVTVVDLTYNHEQLFLVNDWIGRRHTHFMRSKYFTMGGYRKSPKYTWCQRLRTRMEQLFVSWFMINPITGPWQSSVGGVVLNRFERTSVWVCKAAITITVVCLYFGRSTVEVVQDEDRLDQDRLRIDLVIYLAFCGFIIGLFVHLLFEKMILQWMWRPDT